MTEFEDDFDDDEQRRRAAVIRRARVEGIEAAFESALIVCKDVKAPAQARASAQRTLLQIGGLLDRADRQASSLGKPPSEMDGDELEKATQEMLRKRRRALAPKSVGGAFD